MFLCKNLENTNLFDLFWVFIWFLFNDIKKLLKNKQLFYLLFFTTFLIFYCFLFFHEYLSTYGLDGSHICNRCDYVNKKVIFFITFLRLEA